jgi:hypothetical protein
MRENVGTGDSSASFQDMAIWQAEKQTNHLSFTQIRISLQEKHIADAVPEQ